MNVEFYIAKRHFQAIRKLRVTIPLRFFVITLFTLRFSINMSRIASIGIGLGVASLIVVLSVMNGFSGLLWERLLSLNPHITIEPTSDPDLTPSEKEMDAMTRVSGVAGVTPFIETQGYLFRRIPGGGSNQTGVSILGISQAGLMTTSAIANYMWAGEINLSIQDSTSRFSQYGVAIGSYLADKLGAVLGSRIRIGFPPSELGTGRTPPMRRYVVTGIFNTGYADFDTGVAVISLEAAQRDLDMQGKAHGYRIRLADPLSADEVADVLDSGVPHSLRVTPWMEQHANLYASIRLEKWSFYLGLSLIVVIAGFNIVSILSMTVSERRRDIGILKAMGLSEGRIARVFAITGLRIGLSGIVLGTALGVLACLVQMIFEPLKLPGNVFIVNALPVELRFWDLVAITGAALVLCYVFALIPARDAAKLRPVDAIRR
jgi:lipoprotein-releasing system permease protein